MKNKKEMRLSEYVKKYDESLIENILDKYNYDYSTSEEFDGKMKDICERKNIGKRDKNILKIVASVAITVCGIVGTGAIVNAATDGKLVEIVSGFWGAEVVNEDNHELIGTEVVDNSVLIVEEGTEVEDDVESNAKVDEKALFDESHIVTSVSEELLIPFSITEFKTSDGITPEVIMTNGSAAVFYQGKYGGWKCNEGDILKFKFEKYKSEVVEEQAIVVGYVLNGEMHNGLTFKELQGSYELKVEQAGEYYIYVVSATSDYLTLKTGEIKVVY